MQDKLCFVQFLHPGGEHGPDATGSRGWTNAINGHGRKYLHSAGSYVDLINEKPTDGELGFWGEWEAPSAVEVVSDPISDGPRWVHAPYWSPQPSYVGLQNTDPFVFGDHFFYTGCLQYTRRGPTQMRNLSRGSVILFGSKRPGRPEFTIDTVFVVADSIVHSRRDYRRKLASVASATYAAVTLAPWYADVDSCSAPDADRTFRLYRGATIDESVEGMFSFFPCVTKAAIARGFARPAVNIPGVITPTMTQNKRLNPRQSLNEIAPLWCEVVRQVAGQGLSLGMHAELPRKIEKGQCC